jgi:signal transduction histidine kinase
MSVGLRADGAAFRRAGARDEGLRPPWSVELVNNRMLMAMSEARSSGSAVAMAALVLLRDRATPDELTRRFAVAGVNLRPAQAARVVSELEALGLIRLARGAPIPEYVPTALGARMVGHEGRPDAISPLQEVERLRTDLLSVVAHELRTPITVMRTLTGLLLDPSSEPTPDQRQTMLKTMERNAERMQHLIGEILDLARYRSGTIRLQLRKFDAVELAESAIATIAPLAAQRGQTVQLNASRDGAIFVIGDRPRLDRALLNLLANAQKFAPDGGHVSVGVKPLPKGRISWSVTDNGPGIPASDRDRLFERFFVGARDTRAGREGVGLGLPRALAIAQAHGGTIDVSSRVGHGSTFKMIVPAAGPGDDA